jgi:hypothetical protein
MLKILNRILWLVQPITPSIPFVKVTGTNFRRPLPAASKASSTMHVRLLEQRARLDAPASVRARPPGQNESTLGISAVARGVIRRRRET